jgi:hypothetical protein
MHEKNVDALVSLLNKPKDDITKALETEGGLDKLVSDYKTNNQVYGIDDFAKLKLNLKKETIEKLTEADIPESFKANAVGWKLEKLEEEIKKKYQFADDNKGLTDLVDKIVTKAKIPTNNDGDVTALKQQIVDLEKDFDDKLVAKQTEFDSSLIQTDFTKAVNALGLDYEEAEVLKKQKGLVKAAFRDTYRLERKDGKTVIFKGEEMEKDNKLDPLPLKDVLLGVVKDYGFQLESPDPGGHGGKSSTKKAGLSGVSFQEYLVKNNVRPMTEESDKLYVEWKAAQ